MPIKNLSTKLHDIFLNDFVGKKIISVSENKLVDRFFYDYKINFTTDFKK